LKTFELVRGRKAAFSLLKLILSWFLISTFLWALVSVIGKRFGVDFGGLFDAIDRLREYLGHIFEQLLSIMID